MEVVNEIVADEADMTKVRMAAALIRAVQSLQPIMHDAPVLWQEYWDVIGADGLTAVELKALGITANDLTATISLLENLTKFFSGNAPVDTVYRITINRVRRVAAQL